MPARIPTLSSTLPGESFRNTFQSTCWCPAARAPLPPAPRDILGQVLSLRRKAPLAHIPSSPSPSRERKTTKVSHHTCRDNCEPVPVQVGHLDSPWVRGCGVQVLPPPHHSDPGQSSWHNRHPDSTHRRKHRQTTNLPGCPFPTLLDSRDLEERNPNCDLFEGTLRLAPPQTVRTDDQSGNTWDRKATCYCEATDSVRKGGHELHTHRWQLGWHFTRKPVPLL